MTAAVIAALVVLALVDGAFSGFRARLGRTGLVDHTVQDRQGLRQGVLVVALLSAPALLALTVDLTLGAASWSTYRDSGLVFLSVVGPYALIVLLALGVYAALRWELKYLASAVILGPFTLVRPLVVIVAAILAVVRVPGAGIAITAAFATAAVLLVEPILDRALVHRT